MKRPIAPILFFILFQATFLSAQDYLGNDTAFFKKKADLYQYWLENKGLGEALKVEWVQLSHNDLNLEMLLSIREADLDKAINIWQSLVQKFNEENANTDLKTYLYGTFIRMMEIGEDQGNIQIYVPLPNQPPNGKTQFNRCFYVWYWAENGQILEEARINICKGPQPVVVKVEFPKLQQVSNTDQVKISKEVDAATVFRLIEQYAHRRYDTRGYSADTPSHIDVIRKDDYRFEFTVTDIRREVLSDEKRSLPCRFIERWWGNCDDVRRERLEFSFRYIPTNNGYILDGTLTGKFGSGVFKPRVSGYMDMEPDFLEDYLQPYIRRFEQDLKRYLEQH